MSDPEFARWLRQQVDKRIPAAAVRFGDGEGRLLTADRKDVQSMEIATHKLRKETGISFSPNAVLEVKALLTFAFDAADVLGIRYGDGATNERKVWMNRLASLYATRVAAGRPPAALAHCLLSHDIFEMLPEILAGRRVSVISCRDVERQLKANWKTGDVTVYQVPSQYMVRDVDGAYEAALHQTPIWPDVHDRIRSELVVHEHGEVFLVGAGLFGKDLCIHIRDRGGIALDMGSALDRLSGKITRGLTRRALDLYAGGMPASDIASALGRRHDAPIRSCDVSSGIADAVTDDLATWRTRRLKAKYTIVHFDALEIQLGGNEAARWRTCHLAIGVTREGNLDPLGIWWSDTRGTKPWFAVLDDLRQRGVRELPIACFEGFPELAEAIESTFRQTRIQTANNATKPSRGLRKAIASHGPFPNEQAASMLIYLALRRIAAKGAPGGTSSVQ